MQTTDIYDSLYSQISRLPVIDTHEHLPCDEAVRVGDANDVLSEYLLHYLRSDVISAGMKPEELRQVTDTGKNIADRWKIVEPYWDFCRYTGYGRALDYAVKGIYGIDGVNANTVEELNARFSASKKPGHFKRVLKDLCNIEVSLLDVWTFHIESQNPLFRYIWQPQNFICPSEPEGREFISHLEQAYHIRIKCLDDWLEALGAELNYVIKTHGMRVLKSAIAYGRPLRFEKVEYSKANELFSDALDKCGKESAMLSFPRELQDFMMHAVLKLANELNLTFQIHTGLLEGNGNTISNSDPSLLNNLFSEYPNVDFDLFHISYPYQGVACALAKMFPNVYIDMCWAHIISPSACVTALGDFLDAVPYNKISAFGGDYLFPDGVYGHLLISRQNVSRTLAEKVALGVFDEQRALEIAGALYYGNPKRIFKL